MRFKSRADSPFTPIKVYTGKATYKILKEISAKKKLPVSRLVQIAIDNEMDAPNPFYYPVEMPKNTYIENAYVTEARRIVELLEDFPKGIGPEALLLLRRECDIPSRETFMLAYRELLESKIIEEVPVPPRAKFDYPPGYKYVRLKNAGKAPVLQRKKRLLHQLQAEVEAEERAEAEKRAKRAEFLKGEQHE